MSAQAQAALLLRLYELRREARSCLKSVARAAPRAAEYLPGIRGLMGRWAQGVS